MPKLCVTVFEVAFVKLSTIVAFSATEALMLDRFEPSPEKEPSNEPLKEPDALVSPETLIDDAFKVIVPALPFVPPRD